MKRFYFITYLLIALNVYSQCPYQPIAVYGMVHCMYNDEQDNKLYIGGTFNKIYEDSISKIAYYSNGSFHSIGTGLNSQATVYEILRLNNGRLVAIGNNFIINGSPTCIAIWDGTDWSMPNISFQSLSSLYSIVNVGAEYFIGGKFRLVGDNNYYNLLKYNPTTGSYSIINTPLNAEESSIGSLTYLNDTLFASGSLTDNMGNSFPIVYLSNNNSGFLNDIYGTFSLGVGTIEYNNRLIAYGNFNTIDLNAGNNIQYRANSIWYPLNYGLNNSVSRCINYQNKLFASGFFTKADNNINARYIAAWNGIKWCSVNDSIIDDSGVFSINFYKDTIFMTGFFNCDTGALWWNLAKWKYPYFLNNCETNSVMDKNITNTSAIITLFPNPATQTLQVKLPFNYTDEPIQLFDVLGRGMYIPMKLLRSNEVELNVSTLPPGVYEILITQQNGIKHREKVLIVK